MKKFLLIKVLFYCILMRLAAQANIVDSVAVSWDTLKLPQKFSFKKYRQVGSQLIAETAQRLNYSSKFICQTPYTRIIDSVYNMVNLKYLSNDIGKTWQLALDSNIIKSNNISVTSQNNKLAYYKLEDTAYFNRFTSTGRRATFYYQALKKSDDYDGNYTATDSVEIYNGSFGTPSQVFTYYFEPQIYDFDSVIFARFVYKNSSGVLAWNNKSYHYVYSTEGGKNWKPLHSIETNIDEHIPFQIDYAENGFFAFTSAPYTAVYKYPNFSTPFNTYNPNTFFNYSFVSLKDTTYIYTYDGNKNVLTIQTGSGITNIDFPFDLSLKLKGESAIFLDKDKKTLYLTTHTGIYRSEDPLFRTYKKIYEGRISTSQNPLAFSALHSGLYMNNVEGHLLQSKDKGDTWVVISTNNYFENPFDKSYEIDNFFVVFDSLMVFRSKEDKRRIFKTTDFRNVTEANNFDFSGIDFYQIQGDYTLQHNAIPLFLGQRTGKTFQIGQYISKDSGRTWTSTILPIDSIQLFYKTKFKNRTGGTAEKVFIDSNLISIITKTAEIFTSKDNGDTWIQTLKLPQTPIYVNSIKKDSVVLLSFITLPNWQLSAFLTMNNGVTVRNILNFPKLSLTFIGKYFVSDKFLYIHNSGFVTDVVGVTGQARYGLQTKLIPLRLHVDSLKKYARVLKLGIVNIEKSVTICKGEKYNNVAYTANATLIDTFKSPLYDTVYTTRITINPTYILQKDTLLQTTATFEGIHYGNGALITKKLKTIAGCDSTVMYKIIKLNTDTKELPAEFASFQLYPNPITANISISYELKQATWIEIILYNEVGQKVKILQEKVKNTEGVHQITKDLNGIPAGIYQIGITTNEGVFYRRFVKM